MSLIKKAIQDLNDARERIKSKQDSKYLRKVTDQVTDELIQGIEKVGIIHKNRLN